MMENMIPAKSILIIQHIIARFSLGIESTKPESDESILLSDVLRMFREK